MLMLLNGTRAEPTEDPELGSTEIWNYAKRCLIVTAVGAQPDLKSGRAIVTGQSRAPTGTTTLPKVALVTSAKLVYIAEAPHRIPT